MVIQTPGCEWQAVPDAAVDEALALLQDESAIVQCSRCSGSSECARDCSLDAEKKPGGNEDLPVHDVWKWHEQAQQDKCIQQIVQLEQRLMEGAYNKVLEARRHIPHPAYSHFMDRLLNTVQ